MNEQNPPPYHLGKAQTYHRIEIGLLLSGVVILVCFMVAIDTDNLLFLLAIFIFMACPLTVAFFVVDKKIKYWEKPYRLYSQQFSYRPKLKTGIQVPIEVEYQFPTTANSPNTLDRINAAAHDGIDKSFASLWTATDYEETRKIVVEALEEETQVLGIEVFRVRVEKIGIAKTVIR